MRYNEMFKSWKCWEKGCFMEVLLFIDVFLQKLYLELHNEFGQKYKRKSCITDVSMLYKNMRIYENYYRELWISN